MRKFLLKLSFISLFPAGLLLFLECGYRRVPNDFSYKYDYLDEHIESIQILTLGSSLELMGINPDLFHRPAFNAAISAQPLDYDACLFNAFFPRAVSLKVLIVPLSYFTLHYGKHQYRPWLFEYYSKCGFTTPYLKPSDHFAVTTYHHGYLSQTTIQSLRDTGYRMISVNSLGWYRTLGNFAQLDSLSREKSAMQYAKDNIAKSSIENIQHNTATINNIISRCNAKGVSVILLSAPKTDLYLHYVDSNQVAWVVDQGESLQRQYSNVTYLNLFRDSRFCDSDFANANHLNAQGARKLTLILDSIIENHILP